MRSNLHKLGFLVAVAACVTLLPCACRADSNGDSSTDPLALDQSPVIVAPYVVTGVTDPARIAWDKKMSLENGVQVVGTCGITNADVTTRDLFILSITQSLEGGYDSTNIYDRGLMSWGLMQWAGHCDSLPGVLLYIKTRLSTMDSGRLWHKAFVDNGIDVDCKGLIFFRQQPATLAARRVAIRGTATVGSYDPKLVDHWATVMARAGRQPTIQKLQVEYAGKIVDGVLGKEIPGLAFHAPGRTGVTCEDIAANDPYTEALIFVLWDNNPQHAWQTVAAAANAVHAVCGADDPSQWPAGDFADALMRRCKSCDFGNWASRAALVEARNDEVRTAEDTSELTPFEKNYQIVLAERKERHVVELASRHEGMQRSDDLQIGTPTEITVSTTDAIDQMAGMDQFIRASSLALELPPLNRPFDRATPDGAVIASH